MGPGGREEIPSLLQESPLDLSQIIDISSNPPNVPLAYPPQSVLCHCWQTRNCHFMSSKCHRRVLFRHRQLLQSSKYPPQSPVWLCWQTRDRHVTPLGTSCTLKQHRPTVINKNNNIYNRVMLTCNQVLNNSNSITNNNKTTIKTTTSHQPNSNIKSKPMTQAILKDRWKFAHKCQKLRWQGNTEEEVQSKGVDGDIANQKRKITLPLLFLLSVSDCS